MRFDLGASAEHSGVTFIGVRGMYGPICPLADHIRLIIAPQIGFDFSHEGNEPLMIIAWLVGP
jgi:hypothetical protein